MNNAETGFLRRIRNDKKLQISVIAILCAVLLTGLLIISLKSPEQVSRDEVSLYVENTENKLEKLLSSVDGAGRVKVAITVESGMETVLAVSTTVKETSAGKETVQSPIVVNGKTVVLKENYPKITGVLIVAEGAGSISVFKKLQQATVSFLDVNVNQIEILAMK
ncbi:MAG: hypothetical protein IK147_02900 [Clostridia bacterium]|nr:hypothetical protein [Clostridia bacterium]